MAVIIKKIDGKPVFNALNITEEERIRAQKLDKTLEEIVPQIEKEWSRRIIKRSGYRRIDIKVVYKIGEILSKIVDNRNLVASNEKKWVWKAIRELHLKDSSILKSGETRDYLEYFYWTSKFSEEFIKKITWPALRQLFHYTKIREDERFWSWLYEKTKRIDDIKINVIGKFGKNLYALIKNKDTTVLSGKELSEIYECAWRMSL